jgi:hypothetical protein
MQAALNFLASPYPRLAPWLERFIERLHSKDSYLRMLKWNRALDVFMQADATNQALVRIREAFDTAFDNAGFISTDVWRSGEQFDEGEYGGEVWEGSRTCTDPLTDQAVTIRIRLTAYYDGRLACILAAHTHGDRPNVCIRQLFFTRTSELPAASSLPWGVGNAFKDALARAMSEATYQRAIEEACSAIREELDQARMP